MMSILDELAIREWIPFRNPRQPILDFTVPVIDNFGDMWFSLSIALALLIRFPDLQIRVWSEDRTLFDRLIGAGYPSLADWYRKIQLSERLEYRELQTYLDSSDRSAWNFNFFGHKIPLDGISGVSEIVNFDYLQFENRGLHGTDYMAGGTHVTHFVPGPVPGLGWVALPPSPPSAWARIWSFLWFDIPEGRYAGVFVYDSTWITLEKSIRDDSNQHYLIFGRNPTDTAIVDGNLIFLPFIPLPLILEVFSKCSHIRVRWENSLVYALHLNIPFEWDIYQESNGAHIDKMKLFSDWNQQRLMKNTTWPTLHSHLPQLSHREACDGLKLCGIRKGHDGEALVWVWYLNGFQRVVALEDVLSAETYEWKEVIRTYASGHVFLSDERDQVYLTTTEKDGRKQHQFTGGSPVEEKYEKVIFRQGKWAVVFDLDVARDNARTRTLNRTGANILEEYNEIPLVDWVLLETEGVGGNYFKLVCLMHYIVKHYEWPLGFTGKENAVGWAWYKINQLPETPNVAPNAYIVSKTVMELLNRSDKIAVISDFSKTLTAPTNPTTWSVFAKSWLLGEEYTKRRDDLFGQYHDFEIAGNVTQTKKWWEEHLKLFWEFGLAQSLIDSITSNPDYFAPREGLETFLSTISDVEMDVYIVSSGVSNFIDSFLKGRIQPDIVKVFGNTLVIDADGNVSGYRQNTIITPLNKDEHPFDLSYYGKVVLLGDDARDLDMYRGDCLKIGFCDESTPGYNVYLGKNGTLEDVVRLIRNM